MLAPALLLALLGPSPAAPLPQRGTPSAPDGPPPVVPLEGAEAATPEDMAAYVEHVPGTAVSFRMIPIPGGEFTMGSPEDEPGRAPDEGPRVRVRVSPFWMEEHEVTWDEYRVFQFALDRSDRSEATPQDPWADAVSRPTPPYVPMDFGMGVEGYPAICMTQLAARQYTKWLTMKTGRFHRLPTEAEWEYACRAGTDTPWSFGADPEALDRHAWYAGNAGEGYHLVMTLEPNPWGLYDMHGNVAEWVLDAYDPETYARWAAAGEPVTDPVVWPEKVYPRVVRGGGWTDPAPATRSAARRGSDPTWKVRDPQFPKSIWYHTDARFVGFRVVRPLRPPPPEEWERYWAPSSASVKRVLEAQRAGERS